MRDGARRLLSGNEACVEGAIAAGVRFFAGYPISPSTEIAEEMAKRLPAVGGTFIQMEDELAGISAVLGATVGGVKAITATSGPGFSLMQESIGLAAMAEIPCVIVNVQRVGPSSGIATLPAQGDVMQARWGTHGDHPVIALAPSSVAECFEMVVRAVNCAERFRVPAIVLSDASIGYMREVVTLPDASDLELWERPRPDAPAEAAPYHTYAETPSGVPPLADFGGGYNVMLEGHVHDSEGMPQSHAYQLAEEHLARLTNKIARCADEITWVEEMNLDDADVLIVAYGSVGRSAKQAAADAAADGQRVGALRLGTVWPFPADRVAAAARGKKLVVVPEMNLGQIVREVEAATRAIDVPVVPLNRVDGRLITPSQILQTVSDHLP